MESNKKFFYIGTSKFQGFLQLLTDETTGKLFVFDNGGLYQWEDPEKAFLDNKDISQIGEGYIYASEQTERPARYSTWEEIKAAGWDKYVINKPQ